MEQKKPCTKCGAEKSLSEFSVRDKRTGRRHSECRVCLALRYKAWVAAVPGRTVAASKRWLAANLASVREARKRWAAKNKDRVKAVADRWRDNNRAVHRASVAAWQAAHPEVVLASSRKWKTENPDKCSASAARRKAAKLQATPAWGNEFFIAEAYHLAKLRTKATGVEHHVDHIVPLRAKLVSGLHVEFNLRVIPKRVNLRKGNRFWPNMP